MSSLADILTNVDTQVATQVDTRTLRRGEELPVYLRSGLHNLPTLDPEWTWVTTIGGLPAGCLVAASAHGLVILLRIAVYPRAPHSILLSLLRRVLADCHSRGYSHYLVMLDPERPQERGLLDIALRAGASQEGKGVIVWGETIAGKVL